MKHIQCIQGGWQDCPPNAVVSVKASPAGLVGGDWFHVLPADAPEVTAWPQCQGRRFFSSIEAAVKDCGEIRVRQPEDPVAQAVMAAWPHRTMFGKPVEP